MKQYPTYHERMAKTCYGYSFYHFEVGFIWMLCGLFTSLMAHLFPNDNPEWLVILCYAPFGISVIGYLMMIYWLWRAVRFAKEKG